MYNAKTRIVKNDDHTWTMRKIKFRSSFKAIYMYLAWPKTIQDWLNQKLCSNPLILYLHILLCLKTSFFMPFSRYDSFMTESPCHIEISSLISGPLIGASVKKELKVLQLGYRIFFYVHINMVTGINQ